MRIVILTTTLLVMAVLFLPAVSVAFAQTPAANANAQPIRVMTFNIRYNNPNDGEHAWPNRKDRVASMIRFHQADLVGVQEALKGQLDDLAARLPDYTWFGVGRDDGNEAGEFSAIFYRPDRFELLDHDTFWLSETPEIPGSKSWDAAITRVVTWGRFRDKRTGETFYHFNTHFDHRGVQARDESAKLLTRRAQEIAGATPILITGDFNFEDTSNGYKTLVQSFEDARHHALHGHHGPEGTYTGFEVTDKPGPRIDYIFIGNDVRPLYHGTLTDQWNGAYPSDHLPVLAEVVVGKE